MTVLEVLAAAVDAVCGADPSSLSDGEAIVALQQQLNRLEAAATRATATFEAGRTREADGARTAAAWLTTRCRLPASTAKRRVRLARSLRHMPAVEAAWLAGDVSGAVVGLLADARTPGTLDCFERDEAMLVDQATSLSFRHFARVLAYWAYRADPEGNEASAEAQRNARRLHLSQTFRGTWALDGALDPVSGSIVANVLGRIEEALFNADWAEARARVGDSVRTADLARTAPQRRADALVEMARRAAAVPAGARMPEPLFSVLVGYESFAGPICELANGTVVTPGSLVPWLGTAWIERVVFDGPDRVSGVGARRRIFTGATRRAVELRDRERFHDFCEQTAERGQIDHVEPWSAGGATVQANGRVACGFHNRARHRGTEPP